MQEQRENRLIERLRETIRTNHHLTGEYTWHHQTASPPVTVEDLAQAKTQLGFELPSFLRRLYLEVGNGGFGPGYGLFPLNDHNPSSNPLTDSLVAAYLGMRSMSQKDIDNYWADEEEKPSLWPERVLMISDWGCNIYSCLDCSSSDLPIFRMDSNVNFMIEWAIEAPSLQRWLEAWVDGKQLFHLDWEQAAKVSVSRLKQRF
ncbi:MAG TPA: SMI1/KNR4 family protein [Ktedonobacteraceae bacterium]